jgi:ABC-type spermidine/putrescine transport system permease subunit II
MAVGLSLCLDFLRPTRFPASRRKGWHYLSCCSPDARDISFLMPWYIIFSRLNLMDSYVALVLSHMLIALPIVVWIMTTYFGTFRES